MNTRRISAFTLIELLVVIAIIAILAALAFAAFQTAGKKGGQAKSLSNLKQISALAFVFSADNDGLLPVAGADIPGEGSLKWPAVLGKTAKDYRIFIDPSDQESELKELAGLNDSTVNQTSYIYNGLNDVGDRREGTVELRLAQIEHPSQTILFAIHQRIPKGSYNRNFYMDLDQNDHTDGKRILNLNAFIGGANYVFADGSARFISEEEYRPLRRQPLAASENSIKNRGSRKILNPRFV
jgi:prepilin-type N-terminal cleavage/methylation domain-containing protein/prepilin-type processing-associated H-X9-DG protein